MRLFIALCLLYPGAWSKADSSDVVLSGHIRSFLQNVRPSPSLPAVPAQDYALCNTDINGKPEQAEVQTILQIKGRARRFDPEFAVFPVGTKILLKNPDDFPAVANFIGLASKSQRQVDTFGCYLRPQEEMHWDALTRSPTKVPIRATLVDQESLKMVEIPTGIYLVSRNHYFAISDAVGSFEMPRPPPGKHSFRLQHPKNGWPAIVRVNGEPTPIVQGEFEIDISPHLSSLEIEIVE